MSHLTEEASKRVWFINLPEDVEPVTPQDRIAELERENIALHKDKERLDWLTNSLGWIVVGNLNEADPSQYATGDSTLADAWRAAIDAARKEAQP